MPNLRFKLIHVLMRQHETNAVFPQLAHHVREHQRREVVEFIEIDKERAAGTRVGFGTAERRQPER